MKDLFLGLEIAITRQRWSRRIRWDRSSHHIAGFSSIDGQNVWPLSIVIRRSLRTRSSHRCPRSIHTDNNEQNGSTEEMSSGFECRHGCRSTEDLRCQWRPVQDWWVLSLTRRRIEGFPRLVCRQWETKEHADSPFEIGTTSHSLRPARSDDVSWSEAWSDQEDPSVATTEIQR